MDTVFDSNGFLLKNTVSGDINSSIKKIEAIPAVYFHNKNKDIYIGESRSFKNRIKDHISTAKLANDGKLIFYNSETFNASVVYDIETSLINHVNRLINISGLNLNFKNIKNNQADHNYFQKKDYKPYKEIILKDLHEELSRIALKEISTYEDIVINPVYYANPNVISTIEQDDILTSLFSNLEEKENSLHIISGAAGTGKTIVATKVFDKLIKDKFLGKVALTSGIPDLTRGFNDVFKNDLKNKCENFEINTIGKLTNKYWNNEKLDILIVDEGHRMKMANTGKAAPYTTQHIRTDSEFTDLLNIARVVIFIYDEEQVLMPVDKMSPTNFMDSDKKIYNYDLTMQLRSDEQYMKQIEALISCENKKYYSSVKIELHDDFKSFYNALQNDRKSGLAPLIVSTLDRPIKFKAKNTDQFEYGDISLSWMKKQDNWSASKDALALKTVGYHNVIQGFERESLGVIVGNNVVIKEGVLDYDKANRLNDYQRIANDDITSRQLTINRLKMLLTRSKQKLHIFVENEELKNKWKEILK